MRLPTAHATIDNDETPPTRISARLDAAHAARLNLLRRSTGLPLSDLVKRGIDLLYDEQLKKSRVPGEVLQSTKFIASGEGPRDLSENYKEDLAELLDSKHDHR